MLHVLTYAYTDNPKGLPGDWPSITQNVADDAVLPPNWISFTTDAEYNEYVALHKPAYDAVITQQRLARHQQEAWELIKSYRDMREDSGVKHTIDGIDYWFHSDVKSLIKYLFLLFLSTVFASSFPTDLKWKTMSDAEVPITATLVIQIFFKVLELGGKVHAIGRLHRAAMMATSEPLEYNYRDAAIGIPPWPPIYGE